MLFNNSVTRWVARRWLRHAQAVIIRRPPDFVVGPQDDPYMLRWWLVPRNPFFNVYLHQFEHDDEDRALHDHPWPSLSILLRHGIVEIYRPDVGKPVEVTREIQAGTVAYRGAKFSHRLIVPTPGALTIFITGPRIRAWGFHCPQGWRHWEEFTSPINKGEIGRGCE